MDGPEIKTPQGEIIITKAGKAKLTWNSSFKNKWPGRFSRAQQYVDSEILRLSAPLVPLRTSMLMKSGQLGTVIGTGLVRWIAPYARTQYYDTATSRPYDPQRGAYWFERMKTIHGTQIVNGAKRIAGGGNK
ncbi:minor capsid protein [Caproiciproducens faecalis]|uniref:Capsid protein n=1 Tax=Caproiciproducens faecalis TaxID=2820301 RepID=A0ABS7DRZ3_9FIRM|nr:minor capsid protein [Caproiciproducens faecalis]MBW7573914.1 hypothetical protein [Caproiciproducens faecalis]